MREGGDCVADATLMMVQRKAAIFATLISEIMNQDVEIVSNEFVRVTGTGTLRGDAPLVADGAVYRQIMRSGKPAIINNPRKHELCMACARKERCLEKLEICLPIHFEGRVVGAIGVVCSSTFEKAALMENIRMYVEFIDRVCSMLSVAIAEVRDMARLQAENEELRQTVARYESGDYTGEVRALADLEAREIEKALQQFGNDTRGKKLAAHALGISVATLYRKLGGTQEQES